MAVQVKVRLNGGAWQTGGVAAALGDSAELQWVVPDGITVSRWELVDFPTGFALPAGWALAPDGTYYNLDPVPPAFVVTPWGKFMPRGTANGGTKTELDGSVVADPDKIDEGTALSVPSTSLLEDIGATETTQFSDKGWAGDAQWNLRILEALVGVGIAPGADHTVLHSFGGALAWNTNPSVGTLLALHAITITDAGGFLGLGTTPSTVGSVRLSNNTYAYSRNFANTGDVRWAGVSAGNVVTLGDVGFDTLLNGINQSYYSDAIGIGTGVRPATGNFMIPQTSTFMSINSGSADVHLMSCTAADVLLYGDMTMVTRVDGIEVQVGGDYLVFRNTSVTPTIAVEARAAGAGVTLIVRGQNSAAGNGGLLDLRGGVGAGGGVDNGIIFRFGSTQRRRMYQQYWEDADLNSIALVSPNTDPTTSSWDWTDDGARIGATPQSRQTIVPAVTVQAGAATDGRHAVYEFWHDFETSAIGATNLDFEIGTIYGRAFGGFGTDAVFHVSYTFMHTDRSDPGANSGSATMQACYLYLVSTGTMTLVSATAPVYLDAGGPQVPSTPVPPDNHTMRVTMTTNTAHTLDFTLHAEVKAWRQGNP